MNTTPSKKIVKKALYKELVIKRMRDAISNGWQVSSDSFMMDAFIGLYRQLYHDKTEDTTCSVREYIQKIREEGLIVDDSKTLISRDDETMGEIELNSGVWRIQRDIISKYDDLESCFNHDILIAYIRGIGNSVHCRICIGEHFLDFLHELDAWVPLIKEELNSYFITAGKLEQIETIGRTTFEPLVQMIMEDSGFKYRAEYHNENNVELFVWLSNGTRVKFSLTLEELSQESSHLREDIERLDRMVKRYGKFSIGCRK